MSKNGFAGGFLIGALFGGAIGGAIGAVVVSQSRNESKRKPKLTGRDRRFEAVSESTDPELKRRELEAKIAHLNDTIDDVREQLHVVHSSVPVTEASDSPQSTDVVLSDSHH
jgi:hypothetical protein